MLIFRLVLVLAASLPWVYCKKNPYCALCEDHTMCKYKGLGKDCKGHGGSGVTKEEKKEIVDLHNELRSLVASGKESRGVGKGQPPAADLRKLKWDDELAKVAQRWADQCPKDPPHDTCRKDKRWNEVGQNYFWNMRTPENKVNWTNAIYNWYDEVALFNPEEIEKYRFDSETGHYTQMLWHDTTHVGCGRRDYGPNKVYVCNYGPAGNWLRLPVYAIGESCSQCPKGTTCDNHLCASSGKSYRMDSSLEVKGSSPNLIRSKVNLEKTKTKDKTASKNSGEDSNSSQNEKNEPSKSEKTDKDDEGQKEKQVPVGTTTDENKEIALDNATKNEIDRIHTEIENLLKSYIKKFRNLRKEDAPKARAILSRFKSLSYFR